MSRAEDEQGTRLYQTPSGPLPSVTTILDATSDKTALLEWEAFVGKRRADTIKTEAGNLGTLLHLHLENYIKGEERPRGTAPLRVKSRTMADIVIHRGVDPYITDVWGLEVPLYFPSLYAGTTDLIAIEDGSPAIIDYKTAKKMKRREDIENYFCQLAAYALAHNAVYDTNINRGVIYMVDRDLNFERFVVEGDEFYHYAEIWLSRIQAYYAEKTH